jgi:EAL domain-containing protein (putative c-di-GMP-specific phosphodiesterase class I)/GGDEF domain-containing protein
MDSGKQMPQDPVEAALQGEGLEAFFQPILDLFTQNVLGYEVLARGPASAEEATGLFEAARESDRVLDLEEACRGKAFDRIARLLPEHPDTRFFLNLSLESCRDPRFAEGFAPDPIRRLGVPPRNLVLEIREEMVTGHTADFEALAAHLADCGCGIALQDFGGGPGAFSALIATAPQFLKLDRVAVRGVHEHPYKQQLVRAVVAFAQSIDAKLIAEGVEAWEELEMLFRLGVRYGQGFLFARPAAEPSVPDRTLCARLETLARKHSYSSIDLDETIYHTIAPARAVEQGSLTCEDVDEIFKRSHNTDHLVVVREGRPVGLLTRQHYYLETGGPFGYHLLQKKPAETLCKRNALVVQDTIRVTALAKLAMERLPDDLYDPVLAVDAQGRLLGTVTIRQLLTRAADLEVKRAIGANPLTNLPGNRFIQKWIEEALAQESYAVVYADLDRFKEFNDCYGFMRGDDAIRLAARVLSEAAEEVGERARVGHIGGDDFVVVVAGPLPAAVLEGICRRFDEGKDEFFGPEVARRGWYESVDRAGRRVEVPLLTLSLAVISSDTAGVPIHQAVFGQIAAGLKKKIKQVTAETRRSAYLMDRGKTTELILRETEKTAD